jgi:hypothetical protein
MVAHAYPNATDYQAMYWSMNGYKPPVVNVSTPPAPPQLTQYLTKGGGFKWKEGYTAGMIFSYRDDCLPY